MGGLGTMGGGIVLSPTNYTNLHEISPDSEFTENKDL